MDEHEEGIQIERVETAYYAGVSGRRIKPRAEILAPQSLVRLDGTLLEARNLGD